MITIKLKAKHFRFIANLLKSIVAADVFDVLAELKKKVTPDLADDADVEVEVKHTSLIFIYPKLSELPEGRVAELNKEMDYMLRPQIGAGVQSGSPEWYEVYQNIDALKRRNSDQTQLEIDNGKSFLNGDN